MVLVFVIVRVVHPETGETTTEEVPYDYYILHVTLTNKNIETLAGELLTPGCPADTPNAGMVDYPTHKARTVKGR